MERGDFGEIDRSGLVEEGLPVRWRKGSRNGRRRRYVRGLRSGIGDRSWIWGKKRLPVAFRKESDCELLVALASLHAFPARASGPRRRQRPLRQSPRSPCWKYWRAAKVVPFGLVTFSRRVAGFSPGAEDEFSGSGGSVDGEIASDFGSEALGDALGDHGFKHEKEVGQSTAAGGDGVEVVFGNAADAADGTKKGFSQRRVFFGRGGSEGVGRGLPDEGGRIRHHTDDAVPSAAP